MAQNGRNEENPQRIKKENDRRTLCKATREANRINKEICKNSSLDLDKPLTEGEYAMLNETDQKKYMNEIGQHVVLGHIKPHYRHQFADGFWEGAGKDITELLYTLHTNINYYDMLDTPKARTRCQAMAVAHAIASELVNALHSSGLRGATILPRKVHQSSYAIEPARRFIMCNYDVTHPKVMAPAAIHETARRLYKSRIMDELENDDDNYMEIVSKFYDADGKEVDPEDAVDCDTKWRDKNPLKLV